MAAVTACATNTYKNDRRWTSAQGIYGQASKDWYWNGLEWLNVNWHVCVCVVRKWEQIKMMTHTFAKSASNTSQHRTRTECDLPSTAKHRHRRRYILPSCDEIREKRCRWQQTLAWCSPVSKQENCHRACTSHRKSNCDLLGFSVTQTLRLVHSLSLSLAFVASIFLHRWKRISSRFIIRSCYNFELTIWICAMCFHSSVVASAASTASRDAPNERKSKSRQWRENLMSRRKKHSNEWNRKRWKCFINWQLNWILHSIKMVSVDVVVVVCARARCRKNVQIWHRRKPDNRQLHGLTATEFIHCSKSMLEHFILISVAIVLSAWRKCVAFTKSEFPFIHYYLNGIPMYNDKIGFFFASIFT